ncbi:uncharacterized protein EDB91DRAFT_1248570 [Suillus paluster]|uniref:uncharacterized protein n=1 Tax=Suillus paluster TaxID=48578 RepID=UPI001B868A35|nr:uncharacterized protein EDB91DRAFT_1248570 [Suillus paluster]KAG1739811.1 hypothetical protein EDB91DRAFT_1248570 [Suillus paluster]
MSFFERQHQRSKQRSSRSENSQQVNEDEAANGEQDSEYLYGIQSAMDSLPKTLDVAANQIYAKTGCMVAILIRGPQPWLGGQITTWFVHHGWIGDFNNFIQDVFPPEICEARVLQPILSLLTSSCGLTPVVAAATQSTALSCSLMPRVAAATQSVALQPAVSGTPTDTTIQPTATKPVAQPTTTKPVAQPVTACTPGAITTTMSTMSTVTKFSITPTLATVATPSTCSNTLYYNYCNNGTCYIADYLVISCNNNSTCSLTNSTSNKGFRNA